MKTFALLAALLLVPSATFAQSGSPAQALKAVGPGKYLLVLGDSESTGYHYTGFVVTAGGWRCEVSSEIASGHMGWTCLLRADLRGLSPTVRLENLALNGEDTCSFMTRHVCHGSSNPVSGSPPYDTSRFSQLDFALKFLAAHRGQVSAIIFLLGGNDSASSDSYGTILARMRANRDSILSKIRAAAPGADLILPNYPDVTPQDLGPGGAMYDFNAMLAPEAQKYRAFVVDLAHPTLYWHYSFSDTQGGHPSDLGQKQIAELLWANYQDFLHGRQPIPIVVKPTGDHVKAGKMVSFTYSTAPDARVTLKLSSYKRGSKSWSAHADSSGRWKAYWSAAVPKGKVLVKACASKRGSSYCVDESFIVT